MNPYVARVKSRPDLILDENRDGFESAEISAFRYKLSQFESCSVEIGSGSGMHLLGLAEENPDRLHVGFELRFKRTFRTIEKADQRGLKNVFMVRGDAARIAELFQPGEVSAFYIHFPDPWEKKRWKKHRLIQPQYVELLVSLLREDGLLSFRTDHLEYFAEAVQVFSTTPDLMKTSESRMRGKRAPSSEFEALFISLGQEVAACEFRKLHVSRNSLEAPSPSGILKRYSFITFA